MDWSIIEVFPVYGIDGPYKNDCVRDHTFIGRLVADNNVEGSALEVFISRGAGSYVIGKSFL